MMMENMIRENLENPEELEKLYRSNRQEFESIFRISYPEMAGNRLAEYWNIRLQYDYAGEAASVHSPGLIRLLLVCLVCGFLIKLPAIFPGIDQLAFYEKNAAMVIFGGMILYSFSLRGFAPRRQFQITAGILIAAGLYINLLPEAGERHSIMLAYLHFPVVLLGIYALVFTSYQLKNNKLRMDFIRYSAELIIMSGLILAAGMALLGLSMGLFYTIGMDAEKVLTEYIAMWGAVSAPVVAIYLVRRYPAITSRIAPALARIFSPLVLITLLIFLASIPLSGKNLYQDREFLLIFNIMLLAVVAIIAFSIPAFKQKTKPGIQETMLLALAAIALVINLLALSAIIYRIGEFGFSPNKTAVLGANLLMSAHLLLITTGITRVVFGKKTLVLVENILTAYLPLYVIWALLVVLTFPFIFATN